MVRALKSSYLIKKYDRGRRAHLADTVKGGLITLKYTLKK
jgi:hypothetical protein